MVLIVPGAIQVLAACFWETFQGIASREYNFDGLKDICWINNSYVLEPRGKMEGKVHGPTGSRAGGLHGAVCVCFKTLWLHGLMCSRAHGSRAYGSFTGLHGPSRDFTGLHGTSRDFTGLHGTSRAHVHGLTSSRAHGITTFYGLMFTGSRAHGLTFTGSRDHIHGLTGRAMILGNRFSTNSLKK